MYPVGRVGCWPAYTLKLHSSAVLFTAAWQLLFHIDNLRCPATMSDAASLSVLGRKPQSLKDTAMAPLRVKLWSTPKVPSV